MSDDIGIRLAIYRHFAQTGERPAPADVAARAGVDVEEVRAAYPRLRAERILVLEEDGVSIRMAPPFSGVPTPHHVVAGEVGYLPPSCSRSPRARVSMPIRFT